MESLRTPLRRPLGIAAALLPYNHDGSLDWNSFAQHLLHTHRCGLINAVNMDTGYANLLTRSEKRQVLAAARQALGPQVPLVAGVYIEGMDGEPEDLYRREIDAVLEYNAVPILFQTSRLHGAAPATLQRVYKKAVTDASEAYAFELGSMFAPNGEILSLESVRAILEIETFTGLKHSSLNRMMELERIKLRNTLRPSFRIFTGNDLGINMIEYGSDYLLGLATFCPHLFAQRDQLWETGSAEYYALSDSLQHLGNTAFRNPVPAYKHSAAHFLYLTGRISSPHTHPMAPVRPQYEPELMRQCAARLGLADA
jgi:4-hydroxy-tetrahydrodipicolinate synthase